MKKKVKLLILPSTVNSNLTKFRFHPPLDAMRERKKPLVLLPPHLSTLLFLPWETPRHSLHDTLNPPIMLHCGGARRAKTIIQTLFTAALICWVLAQVVKSHTSMSKYHVQCSVMFTQRRSNSCETVSSVRILNLLFLLSEWTQPSGAEVKTQVHHKSFLLFCPEATTERHFQLRWKFGFWGRT